MIRLIGFTGGARVGKDTAANILVEHYAARRYAFADPMREMMKCIGVDHETITDKEAIIPQIGKSYRECMQTLGTEWGRKMINEDLWLIVSRARISQALKAGHIVVISDVRFDNEAHLIRELGGAVVRIVRPGAEEVRQHVSEAGVSRHLVDSTIFNDSFLDVFKERVYGLL